MSQAQPRRPQAAATRQAKVKIVPRAQSSELPFQDRLPPPSASADSSKGSAENDDSGSMIPDGSMRQLMHILQSKGKPQEQQDRAHGQEELVQGSQQPREPQIAGPLVPEAVLGQQVGSGDIAPAMLLGTQAEALHHHADTLASHSLSSPPSPRHSSGSLAPALPSAPLPENVKQALQGQQEGRERRQRQGGNRRKDGR